MPAAQRAAIFDPFTQADVSTARRFGGAGLGLAISRQLVEMMGGALQLESAEAEGSTFSFTLRLPVGDAAALAAPEGSRLSGELVQPVRPLRILLAEDSPSNVKVANAMLRRLGQPPPTVAPSGSQALEQLGRNHYDLVLMDVEMPGMDGLEACRRIRGGKAGAAAAGVAIVAMTAHAAAGYKDKCLAAGMDDHLSKPLDLRRLAGVLRWAAARSESGRAGPAQVAPARQPVAPVANDHAPNAATPDGPLRVARALQRFEGDQDLYDMACDDFLERLPAKQDTLRASLGDWAPENLAQVAHSLKNACGLVGSEECMRLAESLMYAARNKDRDNCVRLTQELETTLGQTEAALREIKRK